MVLLKPTGKPSNHCFLRKLAENHWKYCQALAKGFSKFLNYEVEKRVPFEVESGRMAFVARYVLSRIRQLALDPLTYAERVKSIENQIQTLKIEMEKESRIKDRMLSRREAFNDLASILERVPDYIFQAPAQEVNTHLCHLIEKIVVTPTEIELIFR